MKTRVSQSGRRRNRDAIEVRKTPVQARSTETVAAILEASAHILERHGFEGFNTNAVARRAGVSVGSFYQYFANKDALLSALIQRETAPLLTAAVDVRDRPTFREALHAYIEASMRHQMGRPRLAMLIDFAELREAFRSQVAGTRSQLKTVMEDILLLPGGSRDGDAGATSDDLLAIIRVLMDAAGERGESASSRLVSRIEGAVMGYLAALPKGRARATPKEL